jgi:ATP-binding cassette subfamily B (MDR/TAP) protein 1
METVPMEKSHDNEKEDPLCQFDDREREVIKSQLRMPVVKVGYRTLYRYATGTDISVMLLCSFCAIVAGVSHFRAAILIYSE